VLFSNYKIAQVSEYLLPDKIEKRIISNEKEFKQFVNPKEKGRILIIVNRIPNRKKFKGKITIIGDQIYTKELQGTKKGIIKEIRQHIKSLNPEELEEMLEEISDSDNHAMVIKIHYKNKDVLNRLIDLINYYTQNQLKMLEKD